MRRCTQQEHASYVPECLDPYRDHHPSTSRIHSRLHIRPGPGEICTYIKDHEDPLDGPPRDVWRMYEYAPILTTFDLETELRPHLERL
jgi:hypothetical protein